MEVDLRLDRVPFAVEERLVGFIQRIEPLAVAVTGQARHVILAIHGHLDRLRLKPEMAAPTQSFPRKADG